MDEISPNQLDGIRLNHNPVVEDLLTPNILLSNIEIVGGNIVVELAKGSVQNCATSVCLLRCKNYIGYVSKVNVIFQLFVVLIVTQEQSIWSDN